MSKRKQEEEIKVPVYVHPFVDHPLFCNLTIDTLDKKEIRTDRTFLAKQSSVLQDVLCMESDHPDRLSLPYAYSILTSHSGFSMTLEIPGLMIRTEILKNIGTKLRM